MPPTRQTGGRGPVNYTSERVGTGTPAWMSKTAAAAKGRAHNSRRASESDEENVEPVEPKASKHNNKGKAAPAKSNKSRKSKDNDDQKPLDSETEEQHASNKRKQSKSATQPSRSEDSSKPPSDKPASNKRKPANHSHEQEDVAQEEPAKKPRRSSVVTVDDQSKPGPSKGTIVSMHQLKEQEGQQKLGKQQQQPKARSKPSKRVAQAHADATEQPVLQDITLTINEQLEDTTKAGPSNPKPAAPPHADPDAGTHPAPDRSTAGPSAGPPAQGAVQAAAVAGATEQLPALTPEQEALLRPLDTRPTSSATGTQAFIMLQRQYTQLQGLYQQLKAQKISQLEGLLEEQDQYFQSRQRAMDQQADQWRRRAEEASRKAAQASHTLEQLAAAQDEITHLKRQKLALEERVVQLQADLSHLHTQRAADQEQLQAARQKLQADVALAAGVPGTAGTVMEPPVHTSSGGCAADNNTSSEGPGTLGVQAGGGVCGATPGHSFGMQCPTPAGVSTGIACQYPTPAASMLPQAMDRDAYISEAGVGCQFPTPAPGLVAVPAGEQQATKKSARLHARAQLTTPGTKAAGAAPEAVDGSAPDSVLRSESKQPAARAATRQAGKRGAPVAAAANTLDTSKVDQMDLDITEGVVASQACLVPGSTSVLGTMPSPSQPRPSGSMLTELAAGGYAAAGPAAEGESCNLTTGSAQGAPTASAPTPAPAPGALPGLAADTSECAVKTKLFQTPGGQQVPAPRVVGEAGAHAAAEGADDSPVEGLRTTQVEAQPTGGTGAAVQVKPAVGTHHQQAGQEQPVVKAVMLPPPHIRRKEPFSVAAPPAPVPPPQQTLDSSGSYVVDLNPLSARKRPQTDQVTPAVGIGKDGGVPPNLINTASTPSLVLADTPASPLAAFQLPGAAGPTEARELPKAAHTPPLPSVRMVLAAVAPALAAAPDLAMPLTAAGLPAAAQAVTAAGLPAAAQAVTGAGPQNNSDTSLTVMGPLKLPDLFQYGSVQLGGASVMGPGQALHHPHVQSPEGSHQGSCAAASQQDVPATWQLLPQAGVQQALQLLQPAGVGSAAGTGLHDPSHAPERLSGPSAQTPRHMRQGMTKLTGLEQSFNKADGTYAYHHVMTGFTFQIRDMVTGGEAAPSMTTSSPMTTRVVVHDSDLVDLVGPGAKMVEYMPTQLGSAAALLPEYLQHAMEMHQEQVPNMLAMLVQHLNKAPPARTRV